MKNKITLMLTILLVVFYTQISFAQDGTNDPTFNSTDTGFSNGVDGPIRKIVVQPDGKILIAGAFTHYTLENRQYVARINADRSLDKSFDSHLGANNNIEDVVLQPDGKIIVTGYFTEYAGVSRNRIARLNADGSLDETFNPGTGANNVIYRAALQPDGKIIIGGDFTTYNGANINRFIRLNSDGSIDASFTNTLGVNGGVYALAIQPDGKILVGGIFTQFNTSFRNNIVRVNADGIVDASFISSGADNVVRNFALQPDGKIYVVGLFYNFNNQPKAGLVRLNSNGMIDDSFAGDGISGAGAVDVLMQPDGKIVVVGAFGEYGNDSVNDIARINNDGTLDTSFKAPVKDGGAILDVALTAEGKIIVSGLFREYDYKTNNYITSLESTGSLDATFEIGPGTGADNTVTVMVALSDNKMLIAGQFNNYNGVHKAKIAKVSKDGVLDPDFNTGAGANGTINIITVQADGKILIAGEFTLYNGVARNKIARLNADGSLDESYNPGAYFLVGVVNGVELQNSGKAILGGYLYYNIDGTLRYEYISRFNTDGTYDFTFTSPVVGSNLDGEAKKIIVQKDSKIVVCFGGNSFSSTRVNSVFRLNKDGGLDGSFTALPISIIRGVWDMDKDTNDNIVLFGNAPGEFDDFDKGTLIKLDKDGKIITDFNAKGFALINSLRIHKLKVQGNGKVIISGTFNDYDGVEMHGLGRLNADGSPDATFSSGAGFTTYHNEILDILLQPEDKIIIGGIFNAYNYVGRNCIARLNSTGALDVKTPVATNESVMVYKNNNTLTVTSSNKNISSIAVYDLLGRLVASKNAINEATTRFKDLHLSSTVLIVNTTLEDGNTVSKKIYY